MRVLLDCRMATWTGVGRYTVGIARALARREDIELVQLVMRGDQPPSPDADAVYASKPVLSLAGPREFGRIVRGVAPDITHSAQYPVPSPAAHPLVVTLHDLIPLAIPDSMPSALRREIYRRLNLRAVGRADHIITDSSATALDVVRYLGAPSDKVTSIPLAADDFARGPIAPDLPLGITAPYILCVSNAKPHKDVASLLAAFSSFAEEHPHHRLVLVGVADPAFVTARVSSAHLRGSITLTGRVTDDQLRALYSSCEMFVFPSRYEGFGLPPLEAMHLGAPVITSSATSLPEVVGEAAYLFEPGDVAALAKAMTALADDPLERQRLSDAGRARAATFSWDATAARTVDVYRKALR